MTVAGRRAARKAREKAIIAKTKEATEALAEARMWMREGDLLRAYAAAESAQHLSWDAKSAIGGLHNDE